jgi:hypothetical protein
VANHRQRRKSNIGLVCSSEPIQPVAQADGDNCGFGSVGADGTGADSAVALYYFPSRSVFNSFRISLGWAGGPAKPEVRKGGPHSSAGLGARVGFSFAPDLLSAIYQRCGPVVALDEPAHVVYVWPHALEFAPLPAGRRFTLRNL